MDNSKEQTVRWRWENSRASRTASWQLIKAKQQVAACWGLLKLVAVVVCIYDTRTIEYESIFQLLAQPLNSIRTTEYIWFTVRGFSQMLFHFIKNAFMYHFNKNKTILLWANIRWTVEQNFGGYKIRYWWKSWRKNRGNQNIFNKNLVNQKSNQIHKNYKFRKCFTHVLNLKLNKIILYFFRVDIWTS